jgi:2-polyprenyl-6-methoxyphenol hydroxylase-like FAD-dependent oxidoreductase
MSNDTRPDDTLYDVAIVGYGPVSEILALALARQGRRVAIFERWEQRYPLPRAVCIDHEMFRLLSGLGLRDQLPAVSHAGPWYRWFNAEWKELLAIDWSAESISGGPEVNFVHQPTLESMFDDAVQACPNVSVHLGWEAQSVSQTADHAELVVQHLNRGDTRTVRARYLVGADGANSLVRRTIGSTQEDRGFEADWLVIDVLPNVDAQLDIPSAAQYCNPLRPTTIVPAGIKDGRYFRRWEFMRLPHETREELEHEAIAWQLLAPWVKPHQATIVRHKVYTFRSLLAHQWRDRRLMIAGDAAHVMPPFMGQGMCAGLRDAANLAWKLGLLLDGRADESLLDTYQPERRPHVSDVIDISMFLGKIICIPDPAKAAERDQAFFTGQVPPPPPFPCLTDGLLRRDARSAVQAPAGLLTPHGTVQRGAVRGRYDDVAGRGWLLVTTRPEVLAALGDAQRAQLAEMDAHTVLIGAADATDAAAWRDLDGKFLPWLQQHGVDTLLVRPDFYLYGANAAGAAATEVNALVDDWAADLQRHGVRLAAGTAVKPMADTAAIA